MATQRRPHFLFGKSVVILFAISACFLQPAECNYRALYDYERSTYVNTPASYIVEDEIKTVELDHSVYFYGREYSKLQVSKDGTVTFGDEVVTFKPNPQWPQGFTELTSSADKPFISVFHHNGYSSSYPQNYPGRMYWSQYARKQGEVLTDDNKEHDTFLENLGKSLSHSSVKVEDFQPDLYVLITWENVTNHATAVSGNCSATFNRPCPSATFQVVIAADRTNTFIVFNYAKMDIPYNQAQLMGINGGHGRGWTDVVKCIGACRKQKSYREIPHLLPGLQGSSSYDPVSGSSGGVDSEVLGRFIFVATDDIVVRGGCLPNDENVAGYMDTVEVFPYLVEMLGGQIIKVSGECQAPYSTIYCRFDSDNQKVTVGKISAGMVGWCPVPHLTRRGQVKLEVSSNTNVWRVYTHITALPPDIKERLSEEPAMQPWFEVKPTQLTLTWDGKQLSEDPKATVDIVLVQYQETANKVEWIDLMKLAEMVPNNGFFRFEPTSDSKFICRDNCDDIHLGVMEVRLTRDYIEAANERQYIAVGPLPLAWYVNNKKTEDVGEEWYKNTCEDWAHQSNQQTDWLTELPPCPCTLQQALSDWGRFQADWACNLFDSSSKCTFNRGAKHCVRSVQPTSMAAGSHCCYDNNYNLMYAADSYEGSTSSRAHAWGAAPYNRPGSVPVMSHWLKDLIPYYYCCKWTSNEYCELYTEGRRTPDCRYYDPPGSATIFGDPHVITFDDESYHFGGAGDFWLVSSSGLSLQARFLERRSSAVLHEENKLQPTYISSVAVRGASGSDTVIFTMAPLGDLHPRRLDVMVNQRHYFFEKPLFMWQDFTGMSILNNHIYSTSEKDRHHGNFTVLVESGAGVQVAERNGLLHVVVLLPPHKKENKHTIVQPTSKGLLGSWDEKKTNEYMTPDGSYMPTTETDFIKYKDFALKWAVESNADSLFQFGHPVSDRFPHTDSLSSYLDPKLRPSDSSVSATCNTRDQDYTDPCAYDYYVTGNQTLARDTRAASEAFESLRRLQRKIWSCGWLKIPFAIKDHTNYSAGNTLRVTGCREGLGSSGGVSGGPTEYTCVQNETDHQPFWDPYEVNRDLCSPLSEASLAMIIGIAVGVFVLLVIIAVIIFFVWRSRRSQKESVGNKHRASAREEAAMDPGTDETFIKRRPSDGESVPMRARRTADV